jgi:hypothetical protein
VISSGSPQRFFGDLENWSLAETFARHLSTALARWIDDIDTMLTSLAAMASIFSKKICRFQKPRIGAARTPVAESRIPRALAKIGVSGNDRISGEISAQHGRCVRPVVSMPPAVAENR